MKCVRLCGCGGWKSHKEGHLWTEAQEHKTLKTDITYGLDGVLSMDWIETRARLEQPLYLTFNLHNV